VKDPRRRAITDLERIEEYIADLAARIDVLRAPVGPWRFRQGRHLAPGKYEYDGPWRAYSPEMEWGGEDATAWFRAKAVIPPEMARREVVMRLVPGGEAILRVDGRAVGGLDFSHSEHVLCEKAVAGRAYEVELECCFRDAPDDAIRGDVRLVHHFETAELVVKDRELCALYWDLSAALDFAKTTEETDPALCARILDALKRAAAAMDPYAADAAAYRRAAGRAARILREALYDGNFDRPPGTLHLVGHSHLDLIYVWPYRESVRKNLRTNLIAAGLARRHGDYLFAQSQAKLFADMKRFHPEEYKRVRRMVKAGRFEPVGDMWVEPDCNIPCGEALVRQILYARKFFSREFGTRSTVAWMPDVFGLAGSLPQILAQAGFRLFVSAKFSVWHDTNEFPHGTFWWEGIDGTRIMAHFPPTHFIGRMDPGSLALQWDLYPQKTEAPHVIYTYGFGDGGGGPTEEMIEYAGRLARMDGMPRMEFSTAERFADALVESARDLPVWADELYLEMHRGTYTTRGTLKRKNRRAESALRSAEILSSVAEITAGAPAQPERLEALWKHLCECHFHDGVTGTHCRQAAVEIDRWYDSIIEGAEEIAAAAMKKLAGKGPGAAVVNTAGAATCGHVVWNAAGGDMTLFDGETALETQRLADGARVTFIPEMPALGRKSFTIRPAPPPRKSPFRSTRFTITSPHYRIRFARDGAIASLVDRRACREIFAAPGNRLRLYEDKPGRFEAWEISKDYRARPIGKIRFAGISDGEDGSLLASKILRWEIGDSGMTQEVILYADSRRIDFKTRVDWREEHKLLRVEFPFDLLARSATYEIAFGTITRPTRPTGPYEAAKFEVPFHRWFDVAEPGYGVAVLNDGKYGGSVDGALAGISLLKGARFPDPESDIGVHEFTYSLLPHSGGWRAAGVFEEALMLNNPPRLVPGAAHGEEAYFEISRGGVAIEAFKPAEDGDGWILRLVEYFGMRGQAHVRLPFKAKSVAPCTVTEEDADGEVAPEEHGFTFQCRPHGIHSFRLRV